ncbi:MAG TPA: FHA domain-containing protein [Nannocystaceae bacterium]|nr:FHA domain-containing protein [Nannocystaceae bacterium]
MGPSRPILRIRSPIIGRAEQIFELGDAPVTIGRADECDIVLLEQAASRLHARLLPGAEGWTVVDEGSDAGVFVNGQRVTRALLRDGDTVRVGATDLQLVERPASQPTVVGATRPPSAQGFDASIGHAPTVGPNELPAHAPAAPAPAPPAPAPAIAPARAPAPVRAPAPAPPPLASAPSFVDFGDVGRPVIEPSAPSFVGFGPEPTPPRAPRASHGSFSGELADEPSRIERSEHHEHGSRLGTWLVVIGLFAALTTGVVVLAYDVTWADFVEIFYYD